jgi:hypothetical protein
MNGPRRILFGAPGIGVFLALFPLLWGQTSGTTDPYKSVRDRQVYIATKPGVDAMTRYAASKDIKECAAAEASFKKAVQQFPDSAFIAYQLGKALRCQQIIGPEKVPQALYEFARAVVLDATLGGTIDPRSLNTYLESAYYTCHGTMEGLDQLKTMAKASPLPPADLKIEKASITIDRVNRGCEMYNPQRLWMTIKGILADPHNPTYFDTQLKDSALPLLKGTLVAAKPACQSTELLVAIPLRGQQGNPVAEITLKLDAPLTGKPETGGTIQWSGVPKAFTKDPFMLTMETETAMIENLKATPCGPAPARKAASQRK